LEKEGRLIGRVSSLKIKEKRTSYEKKKLGATSSSRDIHESLKEDRIETRGKELIGT